jgi:indole-3-glycerol phosphate synthase
MTIFDKIVSATNERIKNEKAEISLELLKKHFKSEANFLFPFEKVLAKKEMSFICEVKKASPSKGIIVENFDYKQIAKDYEKGGADAISVLTEPTFFQGSNQYLKEIKEIVSIPVLQKDFIIDEYQIYQAKIIGADAILLICSILSLEQLKKFKDIADSLGLSSLVETHDEIEIEMALRVGAKIIGVNNRNLKDFTVDFRNSIKLRKLVPNNILFVSESGIQTAEDIKILKENNVDAVLIGESIVKQEDKLKTISQLKSKL